uniref:SFRICE_003933 n=1 Tax=Spodoptera frugiperda TaxID=7108 RepID=A0A2H1WLJ5_SPOFR
MSEQLLNIQRLGQAVSRTPGCRERLFGNRKPQAALHHSPRPRQYKFRNFIHFMPRLDLCVRDNVEKTKHK